MDAHGDEDFPDPDDSLHDAPRLGRGQRRNCVDENACGEEGPAEERSCEPLPVEEEKVSTAEPAAAAFSAPEVSEERLVTVADEGSRLTGAVTGRALAVTGVGLFVLAGLLAALFWLGRRSS